VWYNGVTSKTIKSLGKGGKMTPNVWWCNQGELDTDEEEYIGLTLWDYERHNNVVCSQYDEKWWNRYRKSVGEVKKGDIIIHYVSFHKILRKRYHFRAVSCAKEDGRAHGGIKLNLPGYPPLEYTWYDDNVYPKGWIFETEYYDFTGDGIELSQPLRRQIFDLFELEGLDNPLQRDLKVKRPGYFRPFTKDGLELIYQAGRNKGWPDCVTRFL
jgi:hypothetical protein